ncbi:protein-export chaperone SecB [Deinococcus sp. 6YEL10]|uniref:protein-export chaperone SecB n=1 Tax=Deinococcus sp. 6YEL10 TaxID=2745870 RepID=UPI001E4AF3D9|nr:protein-export chaperone SecB [Deinococcus sp. 6YEL10]MCD0160191.1 protein-export chaperone SecB [Deinococcus sp. 6YEL10]
MTSIELGAQHPVALASVDYLSFSFQRFPTGSLNFPEVEMSVTDRAVRGAEGYLMLRVASKPWEGDDDAEDRPVLSFEFTTFARFECAHKDAEKIINIFMAANTPAYIVWPYIRGFVSDMINRAGFPGYHLPLLMIDIKSEGNAIEQSQED